MKTLIEIERLNVSTGPQARLAKYTATLGPRSALVTINKPLRTGELVCIRAELPSGYRLIVVARVTKAGKSVYRLKYKFFDDEEREELTAALNSYRLHKKLAQGASAKVEAAA